MNGVDLFLLGIFAFALHLGFQRGFVRQAASVLSLVVGVSLSGNHYRELATSRWFAFVVEKHGLETAYVAAYLGIFLAVVLAAQIGAALIHQSMKGKPLAFVDGVFGGVLGVAKVYVVCGILVLGVFRFLPPGQLKRHFARSYLAPRIARSMNSALESLPEEYQRGIDDLLTPHAPIQAAFLPVRRDRPLVRVRG